MQWAAVLVLVFMWWTQIVHAQEAPNITDLTFTPDPVTEGENLMLECVAQNNRDAPNNLMFYWYHNETRISDEDSHRMITPSSEDNATRVASSILMVTNVNRNDGGLYRCSVFNRNITDSDTATTFVTVYFAPELTFSTEQGVATGTVRRNVSTSLSLFCRVNAVPAATFVEIRRRNATDEIVLNRTDLDDSNMQSVQYTLSDLMLSDSNDVFSCVANNSVGLREQNFTLVVQVDRPVITTQPMCQLNVVPGRTITFMVQATGSELTYQWQRNGRNLNNGAKYSGTTTATLTVVNVMEADEGNFTCVITNVVDSVTSSVAQLTVLDPPQITQQPTSELEVDPGSTVTFTVAATTGAGSLTYQWQLNGADLTPPPAGVSGANTTTLTIANVQESNEGMYSCVVTNDAGDTNSDTAQLTVLDPPRITIQPDNRLNVIPGSNVMFTVTASGLRLNYTWMQNGSALPSDGRFVTANEMLTIQNVMPSDVGSYSCVVSNAAGNDTSDPARLTLIGPPDITVPQENVAVENGSNAEFTCTAIGLGTLTFMWTANAPVGTLPPSAESSDIAAMNTTSTLSLTSVDTSYRGDYICTVRNERGSDRAQATLSVIVIDNIPDQTVTTGLNVTFNCSAEGSPAISYRWRRTELGSLVERPFEDVDRVSGVTTPTLTILNVGVDDEGEYTCFVSVSDTLVGTRTANLTIQVAPELTFRTEQREVTRHEVRRNVSTSLSLFCRANAVPPATFVEIRRRNASGNEIVLNRTDLDDSNMQFVQYILSNLMLSDSYDVFSCVANNSVGLRERNFTLVVQAPPGEVDSTTVRSENLNLRKTRLTWEAPEDNKAHITTYFILYCVPFTDSTNDTCIGQNTIAVMDPAVPMVDLTDISPERRYRVTIQAENAAGRGPESQSYFFNSPSRDDGRPRNLAGPFVSERGVVLSWQLPPLANNQTDADVIVDTYIINYNRVGNEATMTTSRDPRIAIGGLDPGQMYRFRVSANYSLPVLLSTEEPLELTTERRFVSTTGAPPATTATSITISWMAPPGAEFLVNYIVQFSTASSRRRRQTSNRVRVDPSQTSYTLTGSENGIQPFENYTLQVFADFGNDLVTSIVDPFTVLTREGAPDPPRNLQVIDVFHDYLGLRWEPPTRPNGIITEYIVYYTRDGRTENRIVRDYEEGSIYQLSDLRYGSMFRIQVAARTGAGEGQMSLATTGNTTIGVFAPRMVGSPDGANYRLDINQFEDTYGPLSHYKIVVVLNGAMNMNTRTAVPDGMLRPYDSNDNQMTFYAAASINVGDYQRTFIIGDGQSYTRNGVVFMNSPLRGNQQYVFFVRLYSSQTSVGFNDSRVIQVFIVDCSTLTNPANGQVSHTAGTTFGQNATYSCNTGYNLVGDNTRTCQANGMWSGSVPTCQTVDCGPLCNLTNGQVSHTAGTTFGQTATYSCNTGYNLVGDNTRTCQADGEWSGSAPTCQGQSDNTAAIIGGVVAVIVVVAVTIIMIAFFITRSHRAKFSVPQDVGKEPTNWSHVARSGDEDITTTQCEAYELTKLGHEYEDPSGYQEPEYEIPVSEGPANVPTRKSGE